MKKIFVAFYLIFTVGSANAFLNLHTMPEKEKKELESLQSTVDKMAHFWNNLVKYPGMTSSILVAVLSKKSSEKSLSATSMKNRVNNLKSLIQQISSGHSKSFYTESANKHVEIIPYFVPIVNDIMATQQKVCEGLAKHKYGPIPKSVNVPLVTQQCLSLNPLQTNVDLKVAKEKVKEYAQHEGYKAVY
tara:strand:- start:2448 stop:3014 length:567 start_codon:yes stop_codon:yes gene_type:complete